jgi:hypothetical protein
MWRKGDWSNEGPGVGKPPPTKELFLEPKLLIDLRDWADRQLELFGKELETSQRITGFITIEAGT